MKELRKMTDEQLNNTVGGEEDLSENWTNENCQHPNLSKYNEFREKSYFVFWSIRQQRCRCQSCFKEIWIDVE